MVLYPTKDNGIYVVAGKPIVEHIREVAEHAAAVIALCVLRGAVLLVAGDGQQQEPWV